MDFFDSSGDYPMARIFVSLKHLRHRVDCGCDVLQRIVDMALETHEYSAIVIDLSIRP
jgi:hypothetical protein